ncbi:hypothetical protein GGX14DRAFT_633474 [Mycena pura]|uniref:Uncharacterized protein n=1 Tax=Mycena pura TaxID=153505 RepID=A0AAD6YGI7_9AGAR|nr:hypothetical protein GGX14DRAFT_633474 [Mycena pura]
MVLSTILRVLVHPRARVYNLRLLLLADVVMVVTVGFNVLDEVSRTDRNLGLVCGIVTCLHHILLISTMVKTKELFYRQRLAFLGCCPQSDPNYTPLSILLNRSVARPLVRGESNVIIIARAFIISCVAIGVPAFGLYSIVILPFSAEVYTKSIVYSSAIGIQDSQALTGNASISLEAFNQPGFNIDQINATGVVQNSPEFICPAGWSEMYLMSISVALPSGVNGLYATVDPWYSGEGPTGGLDYLYSTHPIALLPGSHLFGLLTWSARLLSPRGSSQEVCVWLITVQELTLQCTLQPNPNSEGNASHITQLTLQQQYLRTPVQYFRDTTDSSALSGASSLGGFWTFVNGAFVLLFGANVIYFAFGRRPLSALGVVHLFQRRSLSRQWHEDFPALHTEGGLPGSESAGIVAFIRERLVDVGDDPRTSNSMDAAEPSETETLHHQLNSDREESPVLDTQQDENWQGKEYSSDNGTE